MSPAVLLCFGQDPNSPIRMIIAVHNGAILVMICRLWNSSICMKNRSRLISGARLQFSTSRGRCFGWAGKYLADGNLHYLWGTAESG